MKRRCGPSPLARPAAVCTTVCSLSRSRCWQDFEGMQSTIPSKTKRGEVSVGKKRLQKNTMVR